MSDTPRSAPEIRQEAQRLLIAFLDASRPSPFDLVRDEIAEVVPDDAARVAAIHEPVHRAAQELVSTRDELSQLMRRARSAMESAETFIRGGSARFNSLGILQADGPRIDVLCALFHVHVERTVDAIFDALVEVDRLAVELATPPAERSSR